MGSTACSSTGRTKHDVSLQKQVQITALDISSEFPGDNRIGLCAETYTSNDEGRMLKKGRVPRSSVSILPSALFCLLTTFSLFDHFLLT
jgi:hypothetical protein